MSGEMGLDREAEKGRAAKIHCFSSFLVWGEEKLFLHLDDGDDAVGRLALEANADARLARVAARSLRKKATSERVTEEDDGGVL